MSFIPPMAAPARAENAEIKAGFKSPSLRMSHRNVPTAPNSGLIYINVGGTLV